MHIPLFYLPSDMTRTISFGMPTVGHAISFSSRDEDTDEAATTEYLDQLQLGKVYSSKFWTNQDRVTALWWIFIHSRSDAMMTFSYGCDHCGEEHYYDLDMRSISDTIEIIDGPAFLDDVSITVHGQPMVWRIQHLTGEAMELIEGMRVALPEKDEPGYKAALMDLRFWEIVLQCELNDEIETDYLTRAQKRYDLLKTMRPDDEFLKLTAHVKHLQRTLRHGLPVDVQQGSAGLLIPPHTCPATRHKEPAEQFATPLRVPFRNSNFIPNFGPGWLGDLSQQPGAFW